MSLRYALLALLSSGPLTGYDASRHFSSSVGHVWHALDSQIYPELRKMLDEGLLEARSVPWGARGAVKTEYSLSPSGVQALRDLSNEPITYVRERNPARLKAAYFEWADPEAAKQQLHDHMAHYEEQRAQTLQMLEDLKTRRQPTLVRRLAVSSEEDSEKIVEFKIFSYEGILAQAEQEVQWAQRGLALLQKLQTPQEAIGSPE